jgi:hypothetical protein
LLIDTYSEPLNKIFKIISFHVILVIKCLRIYCVQDQWKRGQPVIVSDVTKHLDMSLWHPDSFARDFGEDKNDLINCMTGNLVPNQPMRKFWEGFEHFSRRLKDDRGNPMLLKLKDWPPGKKESENFGCTKLGIYLCTVLQ